MLLDGEYQAGVVFNTNLDQRPFKPMSPSAKKINLQPDQNIEEPVYGSMDFTIYIDTVIQAPRDYREVELIFILQRSGVVLPEVQPRIVKLRTNQPDFEEPRKQRLSFHFAQTMTSLQPPLNLIVEMRTSDPITQDSLRSTAWTVMPLFNPALEPNFGRWRCPMYKVPTNLGIDVRSIADAVHVNDMQLCLRIGAASDPLNNKFNIDEAVKSYYTLAPFHREFFVEQKTLLRAETPDQNPPVSGLDLKLLDRQQTPQSERPGLQPPAKKPTTVETKEQ